MHNHTPQFGPPYDFTKRIDCQACIDMLWAHRRSLCEKYGWDAWPDKLNQGRDFLPSTS